MNRCWPLAVVALAFSACVPYPANGPDAGLIQPAAVTSGPFQPLDAGASSLDSLHFAVRCYGIQEAQQISQSVEASYNRIMLDTDLYSFRPAALYQIVVYGSQEEYRRKTGQPEWSGGVSVGNAIYSFYGPALERTLAHEMTHLIWFEFMGNARGEHRWVNEGLAVYEEEKAAGNGQTRVDLFAPLRGSLRAQPVPMDQMIALVPATEREHTVSMWYAQAEALVSFMIERGGRIGFSQFLAGLRDGKTFDQAVAAAFPGIWRDLNDVQQSWQRALL